MRENGSVSSEFYVTLWKKLHQGSIPWIVFLLKLRTSLILGHWSICPQCFHSAISKCSTHSESKIKSNIVWASFDLQKVLNTTFGKILAFFYSRKHTKILECMGMVPEMDPCFYGVSRAAGAIESFVRSRTIWVPNRWPTIIRNARTKSSEYCCVKINLKNFGRNLQSCQFQKKSS